MGRKIRFARLAFWLPVVVLTLGSIRDSAAKSDFENFSQVVPFTAAELNQFTVATNEALQAYVGPGKECQLLRATGSTAPTQFNALNYTLDIEYSCREGEALLYVESIEWEITPKKPRINLRFLDNSQEQKISFEVNSSLAAPAADEIPGPNSGVYIFYDKFTLVKTSFAWSGNVHYFEALLRVEVDTNWCWGHVDEISTAYLGDVEAAPSVSVQKVVSLVGTVKKSDVCQIDPGVRFFKLRVPYEYMNGYGQISKAPWPNGIVYILPHYDGRIAHQGTRAFHLRLNDFSNFQLVELSLSDPQNILKSVQEAVFTP